MTTTCEQCGSVPAGLVTSRWHIGLIVYGRTMGKQAVLCRSHARSLVLSDLAKTAVLGWWGAYSLFINFFVLLGQIAEYARVGKFAAAPRAGASAQVENALAVGEVA
jgi:hypothetical protein